MDMTQERTTGFAVLDKDGVPCTKEGVQVLKQKLDEQFPSEAGSAALAIMGDTANEPKALAAMLENGTCRYVFVRTEEDVYLLDQKDVEGFTDDLKSAPEGATSWDVAVSTMGRGPETEA